jgi:hypothetical protein
MDAKIKEKYNRTKGGRTEDGKKWEKKKLEYLHRHIHKKITVNFRIERIIHLTDAIQRGIS